MTIVCEAGRWRIKGLGQERARLAYACLDGDQISYTFEPLIGGKTTAAHGRHIVIASSGIALP